MGTRVNYAEIGAGPPIVFVHGLAGCWQHWLECLPHFAERGHRAIALDLPGFGYSPAPPWEAPIPSYGRLVDGFCRAVNAHACTLVGNSMGGLICAEVAVNQPDWIQRLVLVSAAGISSARMRREPAELAVRLAIASATLAERVRGQSLTRRRLRQLAFGNVFDSPQLLRRELLWEFTHHAVEAPGTLPAMRAIAGYDFLERLERIVIPTLVVWGRNDRVVPAADAAGYAERVRDSQVLVYDRTGHVPMAERPTRFNRDLERLVDG
jgi:pimeloyl-ACP methyl ester carboxylesterase